MSIDLSNHSYDDERNLSLTKRALIALDEMQKRLESIENAASEPIAVIGIGCRFPGDVSSPHEFWEFLCEVRDGISEVPPERWNWRDFYSENANSAGKMNVRWGGFLSRVDEFDAEFFGISPREAIHLDPQQRIVMETAWEALEQAGLPSEKLRGSQTGVFLGIYNSDYLCLQHQQPEIIDVHTGTGTVHALAANRLSYFLDLQGPSLTIDTSCSSSLVAIHQAVQSLRLKESNLALAGGVNLILSPTSSLATAKLVTMAADGRCKTFDKRADGIVRGEGCGIVVLKRLSDALHDKDRIWAVIRGSAVNQDGRSNGLTAPNGLAQEAVIKQALANGQVKAEQIGYIEAHGTGTPLGDPIEIESLCTVLGGKTSDSTDCFVGSVKTNIGHLEAAAGIAGFIKTVLALKHRMIPPQLHFVEPNPQFRLEETRLKIADHLRIWKAEDSPRLAGVSAFSIGGTNAHIILEEAPKQETADENKELFHTDSVANELNILEKKSYPLFLSARSQKSLTSTVIEYGKLLSSLIAESKRVSNIDEFDEKTLRDLCKTAVVQRTHHNFRKSFVADSLENLAAQIKTFTDRKNEQNPLSINRSAEGIVLVFPGQGSQWAGMGLSLFKHEPVFRQKFNEAAVFVREYLGINLLSEMEKGDRLYETEIAQPAIWAVETGIAALIQKAGINISGVIGHSVGEVAAAQIAGMLSLEEAARIVCTRAQLMRHIEGNGGMLAVGLSFSEAEKLAESFDLDIAACNSERNVVLSGNIENLEAAESEVLRRGEWCRKLSVRGAFHSRYVKTLQDKLREGLRGLPPRLPQIPFYSTVISGAVFRERTFDEDYWIDNLCQPVLFQQAITAAAAHGHRFFVEAGPQKVLQSDIRLTLKNLGFNAKVISLQQSQGGNHQEFWQSLGQLYENGFAFETGSLLPQGQQIELPFYQWNRQKYWIKSASDKTAKEVFTKENELSAEKNENVQTLERLQTALPFFRKRFDIKTDSILNKHRLNGKSVVSVGHYLSLLIETLENVWAKTPFVIENLNLLEILRIPQTGEKEIQIAVLPSENEADLQIFAESEFTAENRSEWILHAVAKGRKSFSKPQRELKQLSLLKHLTKRDYSSTNKSDSGDKTNVETVQVWCGRDEMLVNFRLNQNSSTPSASISGILPELMINSLEFLPDLLAADERSEEKLQIPFGIGEFFLESPQTDSVWMHLQKLSVSENREEFTFEIAFYDNEGRLFGEIKNFLFKNIEIIVELEEISATENLIYVNEWIEQPLISQETNAARKTEIIHTAPGEQTGINSEKTLISDLFQYQILLPHLENLSVGFILQAFKRLGWHWQSGETFKFSSITATLEIKEEHNRLLFRFFHILSEIGLIEAIGHHEWKVKRLPTEEESQNCGNQEIWNDLFNRFGSYRVEIELLKHCGENLADVLTGRREALELLFADSKSRAFDLYNQSPVAIYLNQQAARAVKLFVEDFQKNRKPNSKLRILEIGGGTGATTVSILPMVAEFCSEYVFTDISPSLLRKAANRFRAFDFFSTKMFDVEKSPLTQDFEADKFDLIIAANVLHATTDLQNSLTNIQKVLAKDAALLLIEGTSAHLWVDLTFGLTTGWWKFTDERAQTSDNWGNFSGHPLISAQNWKKMLQTEGFEEALIFDSSNDFHKQETPAVGHSVLFAGSRFIGKIFDKSSVNDNYFSDLSIKAASAEFQLAEESVSRTSQFITASPSRSWLIFGKADCLLTQNLAAILSSENIECRLVLPFEKDESPTKTLSALPAESSTFVIERIKAEEVEEYADSVRIWEAAGAREKVVVWLWSAETVVAGDSEEEMVGGEMAEAAARQWAESARQCRRLLFLMQSLAETFKQAAEGVRLWVVRAEAASSASAAARAGVLGMGRVFSREHPQLWGGAIEVDLTGRGAEAAREICNEIVQNGGGGSEKGREEEVAYRGGKRYAARLRRADLADLRKGKKRVREDGWYLISGGLGGLGLAVCEWLLEEGAGKVVLGSRRAGRLAEECAPWRAQTAELAKRFGKARVSVRQMDVSEWEEVRKVIREEEEGEEAGGAKLKLRGVIQSAGEVADALLERQDAEKLERVLRAKAAGGWNLHYATLEAEMDFFVLFSSAVTMLGMTGLGGYTAANSILDGLAEYRKAEGLTALSINWSGWERVGMARAVGSQRELQWNSQGLFTLKTKDALEVFGQLLGQDLTRAGVMKVDWNKFCERLNPSQKLYFSDVIEQNPRIGETADSQSKTLTKRLESLPEDSRFEVLMAEVQNSAAQVLGRDPQDFFDTERPLSELGLDSLMSVELRNLLAKLTGLSLPATLLFEVPTVRAIAEYLFRKIDLTENESDFQISASEVEEALLHEILDEIEGLSEAEIQAELDRLAAVQMFQRTETEIKG